MCSILDGCSRAIVHWEIREKCRRLISKRLSNEAEKSTPMQDLESSPVNGPQFFSRDFKEFISIAGMTHVKTSPNYPQSNGKIERYHRTIKGDWIPAKSMACIGDARQAITRYVHHYNTVRLHIAVAYLTSYTKLAGKEKELIAQRDEKLEAARKRRGLRRAGAIQYVA
jgi:putative transposase